MTYYVPNRHGPPICLSFFPRPACVFGVRAASLSAARAMPAPRLRLRPWTPRHDAADARSLCPPPRRRRPGLAGVVSRRTGPLGACSCVDPCASNPVHRPSTRVWSREGRGASDEGQWMAWMTGSASGKWAGVRGSGFRGSARPRAWRGLGRSRAVRAADHSSPPPFLDHDCHVVWLFPRRICAHNDTRLHGTALMFMNSERRRKSIVWLSRLVARRLGHPETPCGTPYRIITCTCDRCRFVLSLSLRSHWTDAVCRHTRAGMPSIPSSCCRPLSGPGSLPSDVRTRRLWCQN